jgi:general secretion pathway protein A
MNSKLLALYGLKFNPFSSELPTEALFVQPKIENFCWRVEHGQVREGGFALINGDPGTGKSVTLRLLADRLVRLPDLRIGVINHPQSNLSDSYRELADIFTVPLRPSNRWAGFKVLRERWLAHLESTRRRVVLLIDEAQEMNPTVLSEMRLLASTRLIRSRCFASCWQAMPSSSKNYVRKHWSHSAVASAPGLPPNMPPTMNWQRVSIIYSPAPATPV